jgi:hypothetical protein
MESKVIKMLSEDKTTELMVIRILLMVIVMESLEMATRFYQMGPRHKERKEI